jgi:hypothetical protein
MVPSPIGMRSFDGNEGSEAWPTWATHWWRTGSITVQSPLAGEDAGKKGRLGDGRHASMSELPNHVGRRQRL